MEADSEATEVPKRPRWPLVVLGLVLLIVAGALVVRRLRRPPPHPGIRVTAMDAGAPATDAGPPLPLEDGEKLLKELAGTWSEHPTWLQWVAALGLRQLVAAVQLVADGESPRPSLAFFSLKRPFSVREEAPPKLPGKKSKRRKAAAAARPSRYFFAPASYARYDIVGAVVTSVNAAAAGDAWVRLAPYAEVAYREIGPPGSHFDAVLAKAIRRMLGVRFLEGEVELVPDGAVYAFKDAQLEGLSKAEKHLLRMGPRSGGAIQAALRDFAAHAHIDVEP